MSRKAERTAAGSMLVRQSRLEDEDRFGTMAVVADDEWADDGSNSLASDLVKGMIAGAVATWAMGQATSWLYQREGESVRRIEEQERGGQGAYSGAAQQLGEFGNIELPQDQRRIFVMVDELMNSVLGLTPGPAAFPWQAHARGLVGHVVFGAATDGTLRLLDQLGTVAAESDIHFRNTLDSDH